MRGKRVEGLEELIIIIVEDENNGITIPRIYKSIFNTREDFINYKTVESMVRRLERNKILQVDKSKNPNIYYK